MAFSANSTSYTCPETQTLINDVGTFGNCQLKKWNMANYELNFRLSSHISEEFNRRTTAFGSFHSSPFVQQVCKRIQPSTESNAPYLPPGQGLSIPDFPLPQNQKSSKIARTE